MTLRTAVLALGVLLLALAVVCLLKGWVVAAAWLGIDGLLLTAGTVWERWRYKANRSEPAAGHWQRTGERFVDPETQALVEVYFDPTTGERSYVDVGQPR